MTRVPGDFTRRHEVTLRRHDSDMTREGHTSAKKYQDYRYRN